MRNVYKNKSIRYFAAIFILSSILSFSCDRVGNEDKDIFYKNCNSRVVMLSDVNEMRIQDNPYSRHIDSILSGLIDTDLISTGLIRFDFNGDDISDIAFEIINLQEFNNNSVPVELDTLALRAHPLNVQILDNSTYGYADALDSDVLVNADGNWTDNIVVLGTLAGGGQFNGNGEKYLGFRLFENDLTKYGWIKIYCSAHNDTLKVIDFAYNNISNSQIMTGQQE